MWGPLLEEYGYENNRLKLIHFHFLCYGDIFTFIIQFKFLVWLVSHWNKNISMLGPVFYQMVYLNYGMKNCLGNDASSCASSASGIWVRQSISE